MKNLNPNQEYVFRACVGDYKSIQEFTFVTEEAAQVPNSGFEDWHYTEQSGAYWKMWYVCASGETPVWNSLNEKTTSEGGGNKGITSYAYIANSGTLQTSDSYSGGLAALVRTVGWGKGTTAPGPFWDGKGQRHQDLSGTEI